MDDLTYLSISTREKPEVCEYPDSGKFIAMATTTDADAFETIQRPGASLDYWEGEP